MLDGVSFDVMPGGITALVGESGSGKSTIGLTTQGLLALDAASRVSGSIRLAGAEVVNAPAALLRDLRRRRVRMVPHDPLSALNPVMRVGRMLQEGAAPGQRGEDWLARVGLPDAARIMASWPHQLSGGQRQRLLIAMAMMSGAPLIVADEPTTTLDVTVQAQTLRLLRQMATDQGTGVLFVTHDLGVASALADRIVVLYGGGGADCATPPLFPGASDRMVRSGGRPRAALAGDGARSACAFAPRCGWAINLCRAVTPPLEPCDSGSEVACHRAAEVRTGVLAAAPGGPLHRCGPKPRCG